MGCLLWMARLNSHLKCSHTLRMYLCSASFVVLEHEWVCGECIHKQGRQARKLMNTETVFRDSRNKLYFAAIEQA